MLLLIFVSLLALCGSTPVDTQTKANLQIVGGTPYNIATVPYQAALEYGKQLICGASIITKYYLLTAAHCRVSSTMSNYQIRVGSNNKGSGGVVYSVEKFVKHPKYNSGSYINDIAYIKTKKAITFNGNVNQATLIAAGSFTTTEPLLITGWGTTSSGGSISPVLLGAVIDFVSDATCKSKYGSGNILPGMICAAAAGKDTCQGDSGGPMVINSTKVLVGITSWGYGCAEPNYPGVYTSIAYFIPWIKSLNIGV